MRLALYTQFLEGDLWEQRLCAAAAGLSLQLEECSRTDDLAELAQSCDAAVIAMDGPGGLGAVRALRAANLLIPVLWIADEPDYAVFAYRYHVNDFLLKSTADWALLAALKHLGEERYENNCLVRHGL